VLFALVFTCLCVWLGERERKKERERKRESERERKERERERERNRERLSKNDYQSPGRAGGSATRGEWLGGGAGGSEGKGLVMA